LRAVLARVREFGWVLFTSRNAVRLVVEALDAIGCAPAEALAHARLGAVGPGTAAALESAGLRASIVPERHQAEGLLEALASGENSPTLRGARVLYPVAEGARDVLRHGLAALGAEVAAIPIYRSAPDPVAAVVREWIAAGSLDLAVLAAPSAVRALVEAAGSELARRLPVAAIGAVTGEAARALGLEVIGEGREATAAGVAEAIVEWARGGTAGRGIRPTGRGGGPPPIER
jgi:uroporphyrinogen III methyltransferase/synthase